MTRQLVYRLGKNGLLSEINNMINAYIYALDKGLEFKVGTHESIYFKRGYTFYFKKFWEHKIYVIQVTVDRKTSNFFHSYGWTQASTRRVSTLTSERGWWIGQRRQPGKNNKSRNGFPFRPLNWACLAPDPVNDKDAECLPVFSLTQS